MNQGDVYWCLFRAPDKRRPAVILTRDSAIRYLSSITVAPITTKTRPINSRVVLSLEDGMVDECDVNLDGIQTLEKGKLEKFITHLSHERMNAIYQALHFALGFDLYLDSETD